MMTIVTGVTARVTATEPRDHVSLLTGLLELPVYSVRSSSRAF
jgi:hypothetical protein